MKLLFVLIIMISSFCLAQEEKKPTCPEGKTFYRGECIRVPGNAVPSNNPPGWRCIDGYFNFNHLYCTKLQIPENATINPDGKSWACKPGFQSYRDTCRAK